MSDYYTENERNGYNNALETPRSQAEMDARRQKDAERGPQDANGRVIQAGTAGADESFLTDAEYAKVQEYKKAFAFAQEQYNAAKAQGAGDNILQEYQRQMEAAHAGAESVRQNSSRGYSGGADGSQYIVPFLGGSSGGGGSVSTPAVEAGSGGSGAASINPATQYGANRDAQAALLEQWRAAATRQADARIDYGVSTSTKALERALMDAQPQFQEQAESVARDERQAMDNSALYAELRGDKGGIGQSQYNEIQAQAAKNRLAVQQAQTKLSTDTARQIEDLRAQGEFQKADAALQISQQYLQQLMNLEQWAAQYNLSAAQFEASIQEWEYEYQLALKQLEVNQQQFNEQMKYNYAGLAQANSQFNANLAQNQKQFDATMSYNTSQSAQKQAASMGTALLNAGIMPSGEQLSAMGMTQEQATQYIQAAQLTAAAKGSKTGGGGGGGSNDGVLTAMLAFGDDNKAVEYLLGLNLPEWRTKDYKALYEGQKPVKKDSELSATGQNLAKSIRGAIANASVGGYSDNKRGVLQIFHDRIEAAEISDKEKDYLLSLLGY